MIPDIINGLFELLGGVLLLANCWRLYHDKEVKGVNVWVTVFFSAWGYWNLFYYPHLGQWFSFAGGLLIAAANSVWVGMAIHYARRRPCEVCAGSGFSTPGTGYDAVCSECGGQG